MSNFQKFTKLTSKINLSTLFNKARSFNAEKYLHYYKSFNAEKYVNNYIKSINHEKYLHYFSWLSKIPPGMRIGGYLGFISATISAINKPWYKNLDDHIFRSMFLFPFKILLYASIGSVNPLYLPFVFFIEFAGTKPNNETPDYDPDYDYHDT